MQSTTDIDALALRLAEARPDAALPCPHCAASVKASNLSRHLAGVHAGLRADAASWTGEDHAIQRWALATNVACVAILFAGIATVPDHDRLLLALFAPALGSVLLVGVLSVFGRLPATLAIDGDELVLRYAFGLARIRVPLPPRSIETGALHERRSVYPGGSDNGPTYDVRVGSYLRLSGPRASLTLGTKSGTGFRKHWAPQGWAQGAARLRVDVVLAPTALVAIEYLLAERGALEPRA
jgi:hypothetical protein